MSQERKEKLVAELINGNTSRITGMLEESAAKRGIRFKICSARASVK